MRKTLEERFLEKVNKEGPFCEKLCSNCWSWTGHFERTGYGRYGGKSFGRKMAHRISYEMFRKQISPDKELDHLCRNRGCVNPYHLEEVTTAENVLRGEGTSAKNARKTHCSRGHEFTPENTIVRNLKNGKKGRKCRICKNELERVRRKTQ